MARSVYLRRFGGYAPRIQIRQFSRLSFLCRRDPGGNVRQWGEPQQLDRVLLHVGRGGSLAPRGARNLCIGDLVVLVGVEYSTHVKYE